METTLYIGLFELRDVTREGGLVHFKVVEKNEAGEELVSAEQVMPEKLFDRLAKTEPEDNGASDISDVKVSRVALELMALLTKDEYDFSKGDITKLFSNLDNTVHNQFVSATKKMWATDSTENIELSTISTILPIGEILTEESAAGLDEHIVKMLRSIHELLMSPEYSFTKGDIEKLNLFVGNMVHNQFQAADKLLWGVRNTDSIKWKEVFRVLSTYEKPVTESPVDNSVDSVE